MKKILLVTLLLMLGSNNAHATPLQGFNIEMGLRCHHILYKEGSYTTASDAKQKARIAISAGSLKQDRLEGKAVAIELLSTTNKNKIEICRSFVRDQLVLGFIQ